MKASLQASTPSTVVIVTSFFSGSKTRFRKVVFSVGVGIPIVRFGQILTDDSICTSDSIRDASRCKENDTRDERPTIHGFST
jgi:hypothetical protein